MLVLTKYRNGETSTIACAIYYFDLLKYVQGSKEHKTHIFSSVVIQGDDRIYAVYDERQNLYCTYYIRDIVDLSNFAKVKLTNI